MPGTRQIEYKRVPQGFHPSIIRELVSAGGLIPLGGAQEAHMRGLMRVSMGLAVVVTALVAAVEPGSAQYRPWCLRAGFSGPGWCGFDSFEQCMASARGEGGSCIENVQLLWQRREQQQKRDAKRQQRQRYDDGRWDSWR
jgi:hypothetical protein